MEKDRRFSSPSSARKFRRPRRINGAAIDAGLAYIIGATSRFGSVTEVRGFREQPAFQRCFVAAIKTGGEKRDVSRLVKELHAVVGTQQGGYDFQHWFFDLLDFSEIVNRRPYWSNDRQIDGSLNVDGTTYLVELKFTGTKADATDIDSFKAKIDSKADNTMGVMVSISGYSSMRRIFICFSLVA